MQTPTARPVDTERLLAAARAAAPLFPATQTLLPGAAQPRTSGAAGTWAAGVSARLTGAAGGDLVVLVGSELVNALDHSPLGQLDLAAAVQPAVDAIATSLGATADAARVLDTGELSAAAAGEGTAVPLMGGGTAEAVLLFDVPAYHAAAGTGPQPTPMVAADLVSTTTTSQRRGIEFLHGVVMEVTVELGRTRMPVRDLLALTPGAVLELDRAAGSPADLLVNGRLIARGEVVVVDEDFGLRITEIIAGSAAS
ncbi:MAG TPA: flagellar motor switch protein FliN [Nocardioidaceae bacterium]|nr:flagellar motor switch protein FliN [Nocardioidaceae bacterium]